MIVELEPDELIYILITHIRQSYNTPNVTITDKSIRKLQKLHVQMNVLRNQTRQTEENLFGREVAAQLAERMRTEGQAEDLTPSFNDTAL